MRLEHRAALLSSFSRELDTSLQRTGEPPLSQPGKSRKEGEKSDSFPFLTYGCVLQGEGRARLGYGALALPKVTLLSGSGDTASRGFLGSVAGLL